MAGRIGAAGLVLAICLAGCDGGGSSEPARTRSVAAANPHVEQLKSLSEFNRGLGLRRAVRDTGQRCKSVQYSGYQEDYKNLSMWTIRCTDGEYAVFIAPNGDVQVRSCKHLATLGLPQCRLPAQAG